MRSWRRTSLAKPKRGWRERALPDGGYWWPRARQYPAPILALRAVSGCSASRSARFSGSGDAEQLPGHWPYTIRIYEIYGQMEYIPLPDSVTRQAIDATTVFNEFTRVRDAARPYAGGMYWKRQGEYEYLVKTSPDNRQRRIGPRDRKSTRLNSSHRCISYA